MRERGCVCVWLMWFMAVLIYQGNIQVMIVLTFCLNKSGTQPVRSKCRNECCNFWSHPIFWVARNMSESHKKMRWGSRWVVIMEFFRDPPPVPPHDPGSNGPAPRILTEILDEAQFFSRRGDEIPTEVSSGPFWSLEWLNPVDFVPSKVVEDGKIWRLKVSGHLFEGYLAWCSYACNSSSWWENLKTIFDARNWRRKRYTPEKRTWNLNIVPWKRRHI